ncbi:hypothetical protein [Lusitaniella coriacea]|nr:hypothetical protein [Lusitaniella coriacea]
MTVQTLCYLPSFDSTSRGFVLNAVPFVVEMGELPQMLNSGLALYSGSI